MFDRERRSPLYGLIVLLVVIGTLFVFVTFKDKDELVQALDGGGSLLAALAAAFAAWQAAKATRSADTTAKRAAIAFANAHKPTLTVDIRTVPGVNGALMAAATVINQSKHLAKDIEVEVSFRNERGIVRVRADEVRPLDPHDDSTVVDLIVGPHLDVDGAIPNFLAVERITTRYSDEYKICRWEMVEFHPLTVSEKTPFPWAKTSERIIELDS